MVTDEGEKQKQLLPTVTVTVTPLATIGRKTRSEAIISTNTVEQREEAFIALVIW